MKLISKDLLRQAITEQGATQRSLARAVKVNPSYINHLTSGRKSTCTTYRAQLISAALGKPTKDLFTSEKMPEGRYPTKAQAAKALKK